MECQRRLCDALNPHSQHPVTSQLPQRRSQRVNGLGTVQFPRAFVLGAEQRVHFHDFFHVGCLLQGQWGIIMGGRGGRGGRGRGFVLSAAACALPSWCSLCGKKSTPFKVHSLRRRGYRNDWAMSIAGLQRALSSYYHRFHIKLLPFLMLLQIALPCRR